jgi:hypothetical protein
MHPRHLRFHVNPGGAPDDIRFELEVIDGETVAELKARVSARVGPHQAFFVLRLDDRPLRLVEPVDALLTSDDESIVVAWHRCSHGAPMHPITGESPCPWDGGEASAVVEY